MTVAINGIDKQGVYVNGVQVKQSLSDANETVNKGVYDATILSAVDAELATVNIKNGITIFGFAGDADVQDISGATAIAAEVIEGETFYAVSGGIRTGTMPIEALDPALNEYPAGYHAGAASLTAVDGELVTGSIKFGVTIFGVAGHTNVRDSSDANLTAAEAPTGKTFYAGGGAKKTGTGTKTLSDANDIVQAGYYAATTLHDVDAQLASINIKAGVTIFGFAGNANVVDTSSGDAVASDMKTGKVAWVDGAEITGDMPTVALNPANSNYPEGYHAGEVGGLVDVDEHLVTANIKSGITIFGVAGKAEVVDTSSGDAVAGDIRTGKKAWVDGAEVTGDIPEVAIVAGSENVPAGIHTATTLSTIDPDLAVGNIKKDVNIFGKGGTYEGGVLTVAQTEVFNGVSVNAWTDLDLSGTVGTNAALVLLKIDGPVELSAVAVRKNGDTDEFEGTTASAYGCALSKHNAGIHTVLLVATDDTGKIEWYTPIAGRDMTIDIIAFWK